MLKDNREKESSSPKISISFQVVKFILKVVIFLLVHCVIIMMMTMIFFNCKMFFHFTEDVGGLSVFFTILHKKSGFSKLIKLKIYCQIRVLKQCS